MANNVAEKVSAPKTDDMSEVCADSRILRLLTKNGQRSSGTHSVEFHQ